MGEFMRDDVVSEGFVALGKSWLQDHAATAKAATSRSGHEYCSALARNIVVYRNIEARIAQKVLLYFLWQCVEHMQDSSPKRFVLLKGLKEDGEHFQFFCRVHQDRRDNIAFVSSLVSIQRFTACAYDCRL